MSRAMCAVSDRPTGRGSRASRTGRAGVGGKSPPIAGDREILGRRIARAWLSRCHGLRDNGGAEGRPVAAASESRQTLWAVVRNLYAGNLLERAVRLSGIAHQFRGIPVDLVEKDAIRCEPVVGRAADHGSVEPPGGAVSRNLR